MIYTVSTDQVPLTIKIFVSEMFTCKEILAFPGTLAWERKILCLVFEGKQIHPSYGSGCFTVDFTSFLGKRTICLATHWYHRAFFSPLLL